MEYANRTARERGLVTCPSCSLELAEADARAEPEPVTVPAPPAETSVDPWRFRSQRDAPRVDPRNPLMVGAGLLLIAAGIWLFRGLKRR